MKGGWRIDRFQKELSAAARQQMRQTSFYRPRYSNRLSLLLIVGKTPTRQNHYSGTLGLIGKICRATAQVVSAKYARRKISSKVVSGKDTSPDFLAGAVRLPYRQSSLKNKSVIYPLGRQGS